MFHQIVRKQDFSKYYMKATRKIFDEKNLSTVYVMIMAYNINFPQYQSPDTRPLAIFQL